MSTRVGLRASFFLCLLFCAFLMNGAVQARGDGLDPQKKILILNSYHYGYKGSDDAVKAFSETLSRLVPENEIRIEYLDSKHYSGKAYDDKLLEMLRFKYRRPHFDLIFSTDDYAFDLLETHREELFGSIPVIFCGTNSFDSRRLAGKHDIAGIDERPSFKDTLDLILKIHPTCKRIIAIRDDSITGRLNGAEFRQQSEVLRNKALFLEWAGLKLEDVVARVGNLKADTVLVYFASFVEDRAGDRVPSEEALRIISAASRVPIYGGWEFNLGKGIVGGRLLNLGDHGVTAALMAAKVLHGASADTLPAVTPSPNKYLFDYAQMSRFHIPESALPPGSLVINKPPGFLWAHRVELLTSLSAILFLALTTIFIKLVFSRKNLSIRNRELERALSKVKLLEGIIPICMRCKKIRKDEESWQQMETYITQHSEAQFSHGMCPDCFENLKQELAARGAGR